MKPILYSTQCPKCTVVEKKLRSKHLEYQEINDVEKMVSKNIMSVPMLEIDGELLNFNEAIKWINEQEEK